VDGRQWAYADDEAGITTYQPIDPDEDRAIFDLLLYHGMTQPEAAEVLGIPLRSFKRRWQAVRLQLMERHGNSFSG
jgi:hypothetical protein